VVQLRMARRWPDLDAGLGGELQGGVIVAGAQQVVDEDAIQAPAAPVQGAVLGRRPQLRQVRQPRPAPLQVRRLRRPRRLQLRAQPPTAALSAA